MISVEGTASTSSVPPAEQDKPSARAHVPDQREGYHRPIYRVVSKCALIREGTTKVPVSISSVHALAAPCSYP